MKRKKIHAQPQQISSFALTFLTEPAAQGAFCDANLRQLCDGIMRFQAVAMYYLLINGGILNREKFDHVQRVLKTM